MASGSAGLGVLLCKEDVYLKKIAMFTQSLELWALSEELSVKTGLLINGGTWLPFRRVGGTEATGRKGKKGLCGNDCSPEQEGQEGSGLEVAPGAGMEWRLVFRGMAVMR